MGNFELKEFSLEEQSSNNFKIIVIDPQEEYKNLVEKLKSDSTMKSIDTKVNPIEIK